MVTSSRSSLRKLRGDIAASIRRGAVAGVALAVHLQLLLMLLAPAAPVSSSTPRQPRRDDDGVRIRWWSPAPSTRIPPPARLPRRPRHGHHRRAAPTPTAAASAPAALNLTLPDTAPRMPAYVAGGRTFSRGLQRSDRAAAPPRLPGGTDTTPTPFVMVPRRQQGLQGLLHVVAAHLGVPDSACVAVDRWRTMSPGQLGEDGLSTADVARIAAAHGCLPRRRGPPSLRP